MRAAADSLVTVLAASEPSKVPFYVAGAVLAAWAVLLAFGGMRMPDFPGSPAAARAIMGISALLVGITLASAVGTASKHHSEAHAEGAAQQGHATPENDPQRGHEPEPAGTGKPQEGAAQGSGGATIEIAADPGGQLRFEQASVTARPGKVAVRFDNPSETPHDVTIARGTQVLGKTKVISGAKDATSVVLEPGSYVFYCSVPGHREAGMEGVVSVQQP
ncbi:MAG: hypothetical protein QOJ97_2752 [Solirubrobacteraceae bacterium]|nr:hypothetical protein [Solirubrobacteraceae bacterium]